MLTYRAKGAPHKLPIQRAFPSHRDSTSPPSEDAIIGDRQQTIKALRASRPKVRTGCVTCKIRRVKSKVKPECDRCTSTGRKCDGYYIPPRKNARKDPDAMIDLPIAPERCLEVVRGTSGELRALEFFHARTAPNLSSYFDAGFWTRLVFQVAHVEPAIMQAMVTVGYLNQRRDTGTKPRPMLQSVIVDDNEGILSAPLKSFRQYEATDHNDTFAMHHYGKAISLLAHRLEDPDAPTEVALLACILFVCIEFLRGDVEPAFTHFKSGMSIALASLAAPASPKAVLTMTRIKEGMLPFFHRLELLAMLFGQEATYEYPITINEAVPASFATVREARDSIVHLMNIGLRFIRRMKKGRYARFVLPDNSAYQAGIARRIEDWKTALDSLILTNNLSHRDLDAAKVLRIHQLILTIWLGTCCEIADCASDAYMAEFEAVVSLGEALQHTAAGTAPEQPETYRPTFLFDMEVVSPLYFVGIKCRHPLIRRRAIALLRQTMRREGLWDSYMAAAIAERIAVLEEVNLTTLDGSELPAERDRVHNTEIHTMARVSRNQYMLRYYSKPHGLDQEWKMWIEHIILETDLISRPELLY
ncbi:hypothetical protein LTR35_002551 [Friedmanniomyces endolithicus]|nr:hypothetical protein LTR35_002551 [Friedmanniomyces endolithicus]KAK0291468.1 hypothetical protein LTS00_008468 [Friedmanniomyces endolithicus]KAK1019944.1 hypothetical protein LTR54_000588 [Friedmanniomyces endolithicus]